MKEGHHDKEDLYTSLVQISKEREQVREARTNGKRVLILTFKQSVRMQTGFIWSGTKLLRAHDLAFRLQTRQRISGPVYSQFFNTSSAQRS